MAVSMMVVKVRSNCDDSESQVEISWSRPACRPSSIPWFRLVCFLHISCLRYSKYSMIAQDHKVLAAALSFVGFASVISQFLTFLNVLAQTFILSGTKVSPLVHLLSCVSNVYLELSKFGAKRGAYAGGETHPQDILARLPFFSCNWRNGWDRP
jgi:hypothetical protein